MSKENEKKTLVQTYERSIKSLRDKNEELGLKNT